MCQQCTRRPQLGRPGGEAVSDHGGVDLGETTRGLLAQTGCELLDEVPSADRYATLLVERNPAPTAADLPGCLPQRLTAPPQQLVAEFCRDESPIRQKAHLQSQIHLALLWRRFRNDTARILVARHGRCALRHCRLSHTQSAPNGDRSCVEEPRRRTRPFTSQGDRACSVVMHRLVVRLAPERDRR